MSRGGGSLEVVMRGRCKMTNLEKEGFAWVTGGGTGKLYRLTIKWTLSKIFPTL